MPSDLQRGGWDSGRGAMAEDPAPSPLAGAAKGAGAPRAGRAVVGGVACQWRLVDRDASKLVRQVGRGDTTAGRKVPAPMGRSAISKMAPA